MPDSESHQLNDVRCPDSTAGPRGKFWKCISTCHCPRDKVFGGGYRNVLFVIGSRERIVSVADLDESWISEVLGDHRAIRDSSLGSRR